MSPLPLTPDKPQTAHRLAVLVYVLYTLGILFGITALIGVIINHTKLADTHGTYSHSHFIWQIGSFWTLFTGVAFTIILFPVKAAVMACLVWWVCSALFGAWFLIKKQPVPFLPTTPERTK